MLAWPQESTQGSLSWLLVVVTVLGWVLAIAFVVRELMQGGAPATTLLWIVLILLLPWVGLVLYYLMPRRLQMRRLKRLRRSQQRWRGQLRPRPNAAGRETGARDGDDASANMWRLLRGVAPDALSGGNAVDWLPEADDFFDAAEAAIAGARSFVHVEVYIFRPDATGQRFLAALTAAAQRGVEVRLLFDSFGSIGLGSSHLVALREAGGKAQAFLPLLWKRRPFTVNLRNHRKLIVVDGEVAFVGGRNIGDEYATGRFDSRSAWQDAMASVRGPAVADLHHVFAEDWFNATDEQLVDPRYFEVRASRGTDSLGVVCSGPDRDVQELWFAIFQAVTGAKTRIDITSPYLVPPPSLLFALRVAAARGVRVRIFTNGEASEMAVLYHAQRSYYDQWIAAGIEVIETVRDYNHTKAMVVDERTVLIGSSNFDLRSAHLNFEIAIVMPDSPALAAAVLETMRCRSAACRPVVTRHRGPFRRLLDGLCRLLSPLL